jgi:NTP pyrophosphatase (non-canonical NTP hydrolase)
MTDNKIDFAKLIEESTAIAKNNGFHDKPMVEEETLMLVISEIVECLESHRKAKFSSQRALTALKTANVDRIFTADFEEFIKDTMEDEFADICIRLAHYAGRKGINAEDVRLEAETELVDLQGTVIENFGKYLFGLTKIVYSIIEDADCVGRSLGRIIFLCNQMDIDLVTHIYLKTEYNKTRPYKHNKVY